MPEKTVAINSKTGDATSEDVPPGLLKKIRQSNDPEALFDLCLKGGKPLLQKRPGLPRRILRLAANSESQESADKVRTQVARHFPESLEKNDLAWLQRLGLQDREIQTIRNVIATNQVTGKKCVSLIARLYELQEFESESAAFDNFAPITIDNPYFYRAYFHALVRDRRVSEAKTSPQGLQFRGVETEYDRIFRNQIRLFAEGDVGFEAFPEGTSAEEGAATATQRLNQIARSLDESHTDQIEGWRWLQEGIIYRHGVSDTALIVYPGPQTVENAEAWTHVIDECNRLGVGQVCLHRRLDRHLTGLGPWKGRPEVTIKFLVEALYSVGIRRIATAGASGTSLAATIAGAESDAAGVLLLPAVTHFPDPEKEPNLRAARAAAREFRHLPPGEYDARPFLQGKTVPVWAHLPEKSDFDRRQIDHLTDYPYLNIVAHDYEKHGILQWLDRQDLLESAISEFFTFLGWIDQ